MKNKWTLLISKWMVVLGSGLQAIVLPIIIYNITQSSELLSLTFIFETIPWIFCAPVIVPIISSIFSLKKIYIVCNYLKAILVFFIPYLIPYTFFICILFFSLGIINSINASIFSTILNNKLEDKNLSKILSISMGIDDALNIIAPICVSLVIMRNISAVNFIYVDAFLLFVAATLTCFVPYTDSKNKFINNENKFIYKINPIKTSLNFFKSINKNTRYLIFSECSRSIVEGMILPLLLIYMINILGHNNQIYTYGQTVNAIAQVIASFIYILMVKYFKALRIINIGTTLIFLSFLCLFLAYDLNLYLFTMVLFGLGTAIRQLVGANFFINSFKDNELSSNLSFVNSIIAISYLIGYCISFFQPLIISLKGYIILCGILIVFPWILYKIKSKELV